MASMITIEIPADQEAVVRRLLALSEELDQVAATAPFGTIFDACEEAVVIGGRDLSSQILEKTVARQIETAEKNGRRSGSAVAAGSRKTEGRSHGNS